MAKQRKRTNKNIPAKGRLRDMCDRMWSLAVKSDWAGKCAVCGGGGKIDSHHVIPRQHQATRYLLRNGIALCVTHHQFCPDVSPHQTNTGWRLWLEEHHPELAQWERDTVKSGEHHDFDGTTTAWYYIGMLDSLREYVSDDDYVRIVGKKFAAYLDSRAAEESMKHAEVKHEPLCETCWPHEEEK